MENQNNETLEHVRLLIIGSGPAGYTAAIYAGRAGLKPVEYCGLLTGGQLTQTTTVDNFPGYPDGVEGFQLMDDLQRQAVRFGVDLRSGAIESVDLSVRPFIVTTDDGNKLLTDALIIATGASAKYLGLDDEKEFNGRGVSACATCDGFFYRKKTVAVVGGGDTACEEASYLAGLCTKVYMIVRKPYLRATEAMRQRVEKNPKIEILYEHNTEGLYGQDHVEGAHVVYRRDEKDERHYDLPIDGFFLAIGHHPNTQVFSPYVECDEQGYIKTKGHSQATNIAGVFAAGDCADAVYRQAVVAAASGAKAAIEAERWLKEQ